MPILRTNLSESSSAPEHPYRWVMLGGLWLVYACFGLTVASMAPLVGSISSELELSRSAMGSVLGAWPLVYIVFAIPAGALIDRFGLKWCLAAAIVVMASSGVLRSLAGGHAELFLAVALFGLGGPLVSIGAPKLISASFASTERGTAIGIYMTGPAVGSIAALALTNSVVMPMTGGSWRGVLIVYAGITLAAGLVWLVIARHPMARLDRVADSARGIKAQFDVFAELLRARSVQIVLTMSVGIFFFNHGLNNWLPEILRTRGMDAQVAGFWASIPTAVGIAGALLIPRYALPERRMRILLSLFACAGVATLLIRLEPGPGLWLGLVAQGIARSSMMAVSMLVLMDSHEVDARHMGAAGGLFFSAAEIGGVLGPVTLGIASDLSGGFGAPLALLSVISMLLVLAALALRAHQRLEP